MTNLEYVRNIIKTMDRVSMLGDELIISTKDGRYAAINYKGDWYIKLELIEELEND